MPDPTRAPCTIGGCDRPQKARGWCTRHYYSWFRTGDPHAVHRVQRPWNVPFEQWFPAQFTPNGECMDWMHGVDRDGYGQTHWDGKNVRTHRAAWVLANGAIPAGLLVLHRCDRPICGNVAHLFLGTDADNVADKVAKGRHRN